MPAFSPHSNERQQAIVCAEQLAAALFQKFGNDLNVALQALQIQVLVAPHDFPGFPWPRLAVWEGDARIIRLFQQPLLQKFSDWQFSARRACAHELFHALAATPDHHLFPSFIFPPLSRSVEEIAAEVFAKIVAQNFRLTLEGNVLNFV